MSRLLYYIILKPLSLLPLSALFVLSNLLYLVFYKLIGYRIGVVDNNLKNSFPHLSEKERLAIRHKFYHHLFDIVVESIKIFSITAEESKARFKVINPEVLDKYYKEGRSVIIVGGHYNNWEMLAVGISHYLQHRPMAIYVRFKNKFLGKKMVTSRGQFGLKMVARDEAKSFFKNLTEPTANIFGADQSPSIAKKVYWTRFLHQDTPVMFGPEKFAKENNYPVFFGAVNKVKRGFYEFKLTLIDDKPIDIPHGYITETHTKLLEKQIIETPEYWLWTHKRWKRKRKPGEEKDPKTVKDQLEAK